VIGLAKLTSQSAATMAMGRSREKTFIVERALIEKLTTPCARHELLY